MQNLITKKKKNFFEKKLTESVAKPKDFRKAPKSVGLASKSGECIFGALAEIQIVKYDKSILKTFKISIQTWKGLCWQNFPSRQIDIQLILCLVYIEICNI